MYAAVLGNHQRRALDMLYALGYLTTRLSPSRFNRRVHALAAWLSLLVETVGAAVVQAQAAICDFVIDSLPVPVCRPSSMNFSVPSRASRASS